MDIEKAENAGTLLGSGDLEGFLAMCDESERVQANSGGVLIVGRLGVLTIEYMNDGRGRNNLEAHAHATEAQAGACYAEMSTQARAAAAEVNELAQLMLGHDVVTANGASPDYIPGNWTTV